MATIEREMTDQQRMEAALVAQAAEHAAAYGGGIESPPVPMGGVEGDFERSCRLKALELASRQYKGRSSYAVVYAASTYADYLITGKLPTEKLPEKIGDAPLPRGLT